MEEKNKYIAEKYELEWLILKTFLKHIKRENLYITFRLAVNHTKSNTDIIHSVIKSCNDNNYRLKLDDIHNIGSDYAYAKSLNDIVKIMHKQLGVVNNILQENTQEFQMLVMNLVNSLLHNCIEYGVRNNMEILEQIGSKIYEECCKALLGDSFEDLIQQEANAPKIEDVIKFMKDGYHMSWDRINEILEASYPFSNATNARYRDEWSRLCRARR